MTGAQLMHKTPVKSCDSVASHGGMVEMENDAESPAKAQDSAFSGTPGGGIRTHVQGIMSPRSALSSPGKKGILPQARTICAPNDSEFEIVKKAWPTLSPSMRAAIMAMVKAATGGVA